MRTLLGRLFGARRSRRAVHRLARQFEDYDLNDVGLVRGAVPASVWEWRRRRAGTV